MHTEILLSIVGDNAQDSEPMHSPHGWIEFSRRQRDICVSYADIRLDGHSCQA